MNADNPPVVDALVGEFVARAGVHAPEGLLLIGSAGRGEAAERDGELLSDLEFLALVTTPSRIGDLHSAARAVEALHQSEAFHVDVGALLPSQLRRARHRFWLWDAVAGGRLVAGHDFRPLLPTVGPESLEHRELNDVLLWQLRRVLAAIDPAVLGDHLTGTGRCPAAPCRSMREAATRAVLDIPTWYLASTGELRVGFARRAAAFAHREEVPTSVRATVASALNARRLGDDQPCAARVGDALAALQWAETTRRAMKPGRRGLSDLCARARVSDARALVRGGALGSALRRPGLLVAPRYRLLRRASELAVDVAEALAGRRQLDDGWAARRDAALADAARSVGWLAEGAARCG